MPDKYEGLVDAAAESPVKRAMGDVWLEATRNSKVKGGKGIKDSIMKLWTQKTEVFNGFARSR